jgi:hypothetical protein
MYDCHTSSTKRNLYNKSKGKGGKYMLDLDNETLLESYYEAIKLNLDIDFISILKDEIKERGLCEKLKSKSAGDLSLIID